MSSLQELPTDLLSAIACYAGKRHGRLRVKFRELLALRCVSKALGDGVRMAIANHPACASIAFRYNDSEDRKVSARGIAAVALVFGRGCQNLDFTGNFSGVGQHGPWPVDLVNPLRDFAVLHTRGRLVELDISYSAISATALLDMCRASPLLKKLRAWGPNLSQHLENNTDEFAVAVSGYCPLLEDVTLHTNYPLSKAESYQMHFPKTRSLRFQSPSIGNTVWNYEPTRYDKIEESARRCEHAEELNLSSCRVTSALAGVLLRGNLQRVTSLNLDGGRTDVSPAVILQLAAKLTALSEVWLPPTFTHTPGFYISLARARPFLKSIYLGDDNSSTLDDACIAAMCKLPLKHLSIEENSTVTSGIIDIILASQAAQTLIELDFCGVDAFTSAAGVLRLVRGCPKVIYLYWYASSDRTLTPLTDGNGQDVDELTELLDNRAPRKGTYLPTYEIEVFDEYGPWRADSYHYSNT